jgi:hypothetical protein
MDKLKLKLYYKKPALVVKSCTSNYLELAWNQPEPYNGVRHYAIVLKHPKSATNIITTDKDTSGPGPITDEYIDLDVKHLNLWRYDVDLVAMHWAHHTLWGYLNAPMLSTSVVIPMPEAPSHEDVDIRAFRTTKDGKTYCTCSWKLPTYPSATYPSATKSETLTLTDKITGKVLLTWTSLQTASGTSQNVVRTSNVNLPASRVDLKVSKTSAKVMTMQTSPSNADSLLQKPSNALKSSPKTRPKVVRKSETPRYTLNGDVPYTEVTFDVSDVLKNISGKVSTFVLGGTLRTEWKPFNRNQAVPKKDYLFEVDLLGDATALKPIVTVTKSAQDTTLSWKIPPYHTKVRSQTMVISSDASPPTTTRAVRGVQQIAAPPVVRKPFVVFRDPPSTKPKTIPRGIVSNPRPTRKVAREVKKSVKTVPVPKSQTVGGMISYQDACVFKVPAETTGSYELAITYEKATNSQQYVTASATGSPFGPPDAPYIENTVVSFDKNGTQDLVIPFTVAENVDLVSLDADGSVISLSDPSTFDVNNPDYRYLVADTLNCVADLQSKTIRVPNYSMKLLALGAHEFQFFSYMENVVIWNRYSSTAWNASVKVTVFDTSPPPPPPILRNDTWTHTSGDDLVGPLVVYFTTSGHGVRVSSSWTSDHVGWTFSVDDDSVPGEVSAHITVPVESLLAIPVGLHRMTLTTFNNDVPTRSPAIFNITVIEPPPPGPILWSEGWSHTSGDLISGPLEVTVEIDTTKATWIDVSSDWDCAKDDWTWTLADDGTDPKTVLKLLTIPVTSLQAIPVGDHELKLITYRNDIPTRNAAILPIKILPITILPGPGFRQGYDVERYASDAEDGATIPLPLRQIEAPWSLSILKISIGNGGYAFAPSEYRLSETEGTSGSSHKIEFDVELDFPCTVGIYLVTIHDSTAATSSISKVYCRINKVLDRRQNKYVYTYLFQNATSLDSLGSAPDLIPYKMSVPMLSDEFIYNDVSWEDSLRTPQYDTYDKNPELWPMYGSPPMNLPIPLYMNTETMSLMKRGHSFKILRVVRLSPSGNITLEPVEYLLTAQTEDNAPVVILVRDEGYEGNVGYKIFCCLTDVRTNTDSMIMSVFLYVKVIRAARSGVNAAKHLFISVYGDLTPDQMT